MESVIKPETGGWKPAQAPSWLVGLFWLAAVQTAGCAPQPPVSGAPVKAQQAITDFWASETPEAVVITVKSDQPLICTTTQKEQPAGILLRCPAAVLDGLKSAYYPPPNPAVRSIRAAETEGNGREVQVFFELGRNLPYEVLSEPDGLKITFRKSAATAPPTTTPAAAMDKPQAPAAAAAAPARVAGIIREVRAEARADAVIIRVIADGPVNEVQKFTIDEKPAKIIFDLIRLRSAYPGEQRIPVQSPWVSRVRHAAHADKVRLVVETRRAYLNDFTVDTLSEGLLITVGPSAAAARQKVKGGAADPAPGCKQ